MPIYDFKCTKCKKIFEKIMDTKIDATLCECGKIAWKIFSGTRFVPFKPYVEENLGDKPIEIKSPKQLRQECNKVGADYQ